MRRGALVTALVLGAAGIAVLAAAAAIDDVLSPGGLLGAVLVVNALVRLQLVRP